MGVKLRGIIPKRKISLKSLSGKSVAIDAYNALYQFLAIIRQPNGTPLKDKTGKITSHLSGLLYRTVNLVEIGIKPIYIFDGTPPVLKEVEIKRRMKVKEEAIIKYEQALKEGKKEEARIYAQATSRLKEYMTEDSKRLLTLLGIPWVQSPGEGEAQAAYLTKKGASDYCASQDYDSLLFGATRLIRNLTISGRRKLPRKKVYVKVVPEIINLNRVLRELEITYEQLIDVCILIGTDFNPDGVRGVGPKTALKIIKEKGSLEEASSLKAGFPVDPKRIREIFLHPRVTNNYKLNWKKPNVEGAFDFLCSEKNFSEERIQKALEKMVEGITKSKKKVTLEAFFG